MPATATKPRLPYPRTVKGFVRKYAPCDDARKWLKSQPDMRAAWDACHRPDWMLWAIEQMDLGDDRTLSLFAVWCARQVEHLMQDPRSRAALDVAERFTNGQATRDELDAAWDAANAARAAARAARAARAASAAWDAARAAARDAARAAAWDAAWDARDAAWDARDAARAAASARQADHLRTLIQNPWV